jgi:hypothetical protein
MKTFLIICSVILNLALVKAQNSVCDELFDKYAGKEGFTTLYLNGSNLGLLFNKNGNRSCKDLSFRLLSANDSVYNGSINFYKEVVPFLNKNKYKELMSVNKKDQKLVVLCKQTKNKITEIILVSGGKNNLLINFNGEITLSEAIQVSKSFSDNDEVQNLE